MKIENRLNSEVWEVGDTFILEDLGVFLICFSTDDNYYVLNLKTNILTPYPTANSAHETVCLFRTTMSNHRGISKVISTIVLN